MKTTHKILFALLLLPLLLAACRPLTPDPSASPIPTLPPAQVDGGLPLRPGEDPIERWRENRLFRDTEVILPEKAVNFPVLIVERLPLDLNALESFMRVNIPEGAFLDEEVHYFKDGDYIDKASYGDRHSVYTLHSDAYETDWGEERAWLSEDVLLSNGHFRKRFEDLPLYGSQNADSGGEEGFGEFPYTEQEAVDLVLATLAGWGVPVEELEVEYIWSYGPASPVSIIRESQKSMGYAPGRWLWNEYTCHPIDAMLPFGGRGISIALRHKLYEIPVYDLGYRHDRDPSLEIPEPSPGADLEAREKYMELVIKNWINFDGDSSQAIVTDLGLRDLHISFHRVVSVEKHDVPIMPVSDVIAINLDAIEALGRIARIELVLAPTYYEWQFQETRFRLVPVWCFIPETYPGELPYNHVIIDAMEGKTIIPLDDSWRLWPPGIE